MDSEQWRPVIGFGDKFAVSNLGRVKALPHEVGHWCGRTIPKPGGILTQSRHSAGYSLVSLRDGKKHYVHRLVMAAFIGDPEGREVNHLNGDKSDNRLANLEYCDRLHNVRHAIATGLQDNSGEGNGLNKYTADQIRHGYSLVVSGMKYADAARECGVNQGALEAACRGVNWKSLGLTPIQRYPVNP